MILQKNILMIVSVGTHVSMHNYTYIDQNQLFLILRQRFEIQKKTHDDIESSNEVKMTLVVDKWLYSLN